MAAAPEESGAGRREAPCSGALGGMRGQKAALGNEKLNNVNNYNRTGRWAAAEALSRRPFPSGARRGHIPSGAAAPLRAPGSPSREGGAAPKGH